MKYAFSLWSFIALLAVPITSFADNRFYSYNDNGGFGWYQTPHSSHEYNRHVPERENITWTHRGQVDSDGILSPGEIPNPLINYRSRPDGCEYNDPRRGYHDNYFYNSSDGYYRNPGIWRR